MSQEDQHVELREQTQQLLQGRLKHVRAAALAGALIPLAAVALSTGVTRAQGQSGGVPITLVDVTNNPNGFSSPAGIACLGSSGKLVTSVNAPSGVPNNFDMVDPVTGTVTQFSTVSGAAGEIKIGTVHATANLGGFAAGSVYAGNGVAGQILRLSADGANVTNPWVTLPGETAPITGLFQDEYGVAGGDFVATTGNEQNGTASDFVGSVWRINSSQVATHLLDYGKHLEGVTTVPNDPVKYGPLAGKILAGDEDRVVTTSEQDGYACRLIAIDPNTGQISATLSTDDDAPAMGTTPANFHVATQLCPEDIDVIPAEGSFYGVDASNNRVVSAPASEFAPFVGDILVTKEIPSGDSDFPPPHSLSNSGLIVLHWDNDLLQFTETQLTSNQGIARWEHVTFAGGTSCGEAIVLVPAVMISKFTNGADANDPNAAGVPNIAAGDSIAWTYRVTNIGNTPVPGIDVVVTDNTTGVTPAFTSVLSGNGDMIFDPGEVWLFTATGTALDLTSPAPAGVHTAPNSCTAGGTQTARTAYTNLGMASIPGASATDPSSYCNPPAKVTIVKFTNGQDANDPNGIDVPNISPGAAVTWTYRVTNTGQSSVATAQVSVTDNTPGVTPAFASEIIGNGDPILEPGETWLYTATGIALNLTLPPPAGVHTVANSCTASGTQPARTAYTNIGSVAIPGATAADASSYCNPPPPTKSIAIGPSSMEGAIRISAGDWVNGGYSFKTNFTGNITIAATVSLTGKCIGGTLPSDTLTVTLGNVGYLAVSGADWKPTGDQNSILSWQGSAVAPPTLCGGGGGKLDASKGAVFNATITGAPTGKLVTFRFKYRDPAAKGKPNTNCLNAADPNRQKADVCGASWSETKIDP